MSRTVHHYQEAGCINMRRALMRMVQLTQHHAAIDADQWYLGACRWDLALELLQQMQLEGVHPSTACLTSTISACMHGKFHEGSLDQLLESLSTQAITFVLLASECALSPETQDTILLT